ncbi:MAG: sensor histidine kinase [Faecalibacterium sp.]
MRKSISVAFFSLVSTLMVLGIVLMGASEWVLFKNYFAKDRYETLDQVVGVTQRTAQYLVQQAELPEGDELDALSTKLEIIGESAEAYLFFTDNDGRVMIASSPDKLESLTVPEEMMEKIDASDADYYHVFGTLGGMLDGKSYITVSEMRNEHGQPSGYLFLCSSGEQLTQFKQQFWSNFLLSACVMLLCASILTKILMRQLTDPLQKVTDAAQRFGGGDLSVRVEGVEGEGEAADLARTFNRMADNIQMNDNSRGQFMGNIAHELRTPMTTIKGFVDGILDGTIPPEMQNHYLQLVSEETGRLARLIQNMLDLSKLESGEYQVNARMFNIWETLTGVALAAEQRINDGMIELEGLTMDEKVLVYADPDLIHQVAYNLLDNAIKFTPAGGTIRFSVEKLGPEAEISIWNSGQGISPEALPYVFERFYKEDRSRGLHARGSGLGLNICKVLVNLAGGQIRVESQQGEWCRFVFTLPTCSPNPGGMKRLPDAAGQPGAVEDPASMKPVE